MTIKRTLETLNGASAADFVAVLGNIVERSPWVAEGAERKRPFADLGQLCTALLGEFRAAPRERQIRLIRLHPDLANKAHRADGLTPDSTAEQDSAGLVRLTKVEIALFDNANKAYKAKFGFPFILGARRHTRDSILAMFASRLKNEPAREEQTAVDEICRISTLRLADLMEGGEKLGAYGHLSTHVLDTHAGKPAVGVELELIELARHGTDRTLVKTITNADGRTDEALIHGRPVPIGTYELRFDTARYFAARGIPLGTPPFLDTIPIRFSVAEPEARLHVPLLMTPWSYTTYRGS